MLDACNFSSGGEVMCKIINSGFRVNSDNQRQTQYIIEIREAN